MKAFGNAAVSMPTELIDGIGKMGSELNKAATNVLRVSFIFLKIILIDYTLFGYFETSIGIIS